MAERTSFVNFRLSDTEQRALKFLAYREGVNRSEWLRLIIRRECERIGLPPGFIGLVSLVESEADNGK